MTTEGKVRESDLKTPPCQGEDASRGRHQGCWLFLEAGQGRKQVSPRASRRNTALLNLILGHVTSKTVNLCSFLSFYFWPSCVDELFRESQAPCRAVCGTRGSLRTMHGGGSAPSCCEIGRAHV